MQVLLMFKLISIQRLLCLGFTANDLILFLGFRKYKPQKYGGGRSSPPYFWGLYGSFFCLGSPNHLLGGGGDDRTGEEIALSILTA
jgi:hypothetical protein